MKLVEPVSMNVQIIGESIMKISEIDESILDEAHGNSKKYDKCWKGYRKVKGKKRGEKGSCKKIGETSSAGATSAGGIAGTANGFASGGIGTISRAGPISKKKKKKSASR